MTRMRVEAHEGQPLPCGCQARAYTTGAQATPLHLHRASVSPVNQGAILRSCCISKTGSARLAQRPGAQRAA